MREEVLGASFRDPSGHVFEREGSLYRQINRSYAPDYDQLMSCGLYQRLVDQGLLVAHEEVDEPPADPGPGVDPYRVIRPEPIPFISYPYEWCFSQLKDAALLTLRLQREAVARGMSLKDASVYNIQFRQGRPVMIDTLSFERYQEGEPWAAYRQFCQHFLAPLALMSLRDVRLIQLLRSHLDGVPLDLAASLLPLRSWWNLGLLMHIRLHARYQKRHDGSGADAPGAARPARKLARKGLLDMVVQLENTVRGLSWSPRGTEWADYTSGDSYAMQAFDEKKAIVTRHLETIQPGTVWDLGANTGLYSRLAAETGANVIAFDIDPACVERNYQKVRADGDLRVLPLLLDLANPSPALGWANRERGSLGERRLPNALLALALIHHLAISNNVPLEHIAGYFAQLADSLIIEFVPKSDAKVRLLLASRPDIFPHYSEKGFEAAFDRHWEIAERTPISGSQRILYRMRRRNTGSKTPITRATADA